jgi:hypothetical protein
MTKSIYGFSYFPRIKAERQRERSIEYGAGVSSFDVFMFAISLLCGVAVIADYTFKLNLFN